MVIASSIGLLWYTSRNVANRQQRFDTALAAYKQEADSIKLSPVPVAASDLPRVKPLLDKAKALQTEAANAGHSEIGLGLAQQEKLTTAADLIYRRTLENILLPRLVSALESRMRNWWNNST